MINVSVMWPNSDDATFDHDYYMETHIPMLVELLGDALKNVEVDRGIGGLQPGAPPPYVAITHLHFDSVDDFQRAFGPHAERITGDEPNFTNIAVKVQISEVVK
jgi:uncharacterized protein (TIGR02118 family)